MHRAGGVGLEPRPGFFRWRVARDRPWKAIRISRVDGVWVVLINGDVAPKTGHADDWINDPFLRQWWPLHEISQAEHDRLIAEHRDAAPGSPLRTPDEPVDLRAAPVMGGAP